MTADLALQPRGHQPAAQSPAFCSYMCAGDSLSPSRKVRPSASSRRPRFTRHQSLRCTAGEAQLGPAAVAVFEEVKAPLSEQQPSTVPILSGGGGGIFFFWQLGIVKYLEERYDLTKIHARGASAGALLATLAACNVDPRCALDSAHRLAVEAKLWDRKLKLAGVWGDLIRVWLYELLPANAADLVRGRLTLVVTDVRGRLKQVPLTDFADNKELIEANMASVHVPFFLDFQPFSWYRGRPYVDGSLADFVRGDNSDLLTCKGQAVVLDYFEDTELQYKRMDFLKLPSHEGAIELMNKGYCFAERVAATGEYEQKFGSVRRTVKQKRS